MAATMPPSPTDSNLDGPRPLDITARVTFYTKARSSAKGKKAKSNTTKDSKDTRAKEFTHLFAANESNYLKFLQAILDSHHLLKYKAADLTDQVSFPCKVQVPPATYVTFDSSVLRADYMLL